MRLGFLLIVGVCLFGGGVAGDDAPQCKLQNKVCFPGNDIRIDTSATTPEEVNLQLMSPHTMAVLHSLLIGAELHKLYLQRQGDWQMLPQVWFA